MDVPITTLQLRPKITGLIDSYTEGLRSLSVALMLHVHNTQQHMLVYVVTQRYPYSDTDIVSVYQNMDAVMHKMEITRLHGMDELEEIKIECVEVVSEDTALERLNNVRKYKQQTND